MARTLRVGMIGYGFMGKAHSNAWRQVSHFFPLKAKVEMHTICGRDRAHVEAARGQLGWQLAATDWREVIESPLIDIVDICTSNVSHTEIALAAARAAKSILCEKPLALNVADAEKMVAAVRKSKVKNMVVFNYRRVPAIAFAKQMIDSGQLGQIRHFRGTYLQDWIVDPAFPLVWRLRREQAGSGALGDIGSHVVDLARFLVGEITDVSGALETFVTERPLPGHPSRTGAVTVDDAVVACLRFEGGAIGTLEATRMAPGRKNANRFEINGSKGSLAFDLERLNELEVYFESDPPGQRGFRTILVTDATHPYMKSWWPPGHVIGWEHTFTHMVYDLCEAMADGRVPSPNFEDGVRNQYVLDAIERAARSRRWVRIRPGM